MGSVPASIFSDSTESMQVQYNEQYRASIPAHESNGIVSPFRPVHSSTDCTYKDNTFQATDNQQTTLFVYSPNMSSEEQYGKFRKTYSVVDLDCIVDNVKTLRRKCGRVERFAAVIKADAYGHGARPVAHALMQANAVDAFVVALVEEAIELRQSGISAPILVTAGSFTGSYEAVVLNSLIPVVGNSADLHSFSETGRRLQRSVNVHIEIDVGMARLGFAVDSLQNLIRLAQGLDHIEIVGIMAHPSHAELPDAHRTTTQCEELQVISEKLEQKLDRLASTVTLPPFHLSSTSNQYSPSSSSPSSRSASPASAHLHTNNRGLDFPSNTRKHHNSLKRIRHFANSGALASAPNEEGWGLVRVGLATFGVQPVPAKTISGLKPALCWYTSVVAIRQVKIGETVGYDGTWTAMRPSTVATLSVGYADGYPRSLSNVGQVTIFGQRANIVGNVCE